MFVLKAFPAQILKELDTYVLSIYTENKDLSYFVVPNSKYVIRITT